MNTPNYRRMGITCITLAALSLMLVGVLAAEMGMSPPQIVLIVAAFLIGTIGGASMALFAALDVLSEDDEGGAA